MRRRRFFSLLLLAAAGAWPRTLRAGQAPDPVNAEMPATSGSNSHTIKLFLCGDVMTGRGIDQILPHPVSPELYEPWMSSALHYVKLAERASGPIPRPVDFSYVWGDALAALEQEAPDLRIINLETAVTTSGAHWIDKGIHYRMHPANTPCLAAAGIDCCVLANNHVLDWGYTGLQETVQTLRDAGIKTAGAGSDIEQAAAPAVFDRGEQRRVLVFSMGLASSGIGRAWAAGVRRPGVWLLRDLSPASVEAVARRVQAVRQPGDIVIASIHWGGNWGYAIDPRQRHFAHALIEHAGVDLLHGHSSHHPRGVELYRGKLILYGCGDFLNDYEGIQGYETFRGDLSLMYLPVVDPRNGTLVSLTMRPMQTHRFRLRHASEADSHWLADTMRRESGRLGTCVKLDGDVLKVAL